MAEGRGFREEGSGFLVSIVWTQGWNLCRAVKNAACAKDGYSLRGALPAL